MWFCFGLITLVAATIWGLRIRLAARWSGGPERLGKSRFELQEVRHRKRLVLIRLGLPVRAPAGLRFRVRAERAHDVFFKWLGVSSEIQTNDAQLDSTVYIESDARATAVLLRRDPRLRVALRDIFSIARVQRLSRVRLRCAGGRLWIEFKPAREEDLFAAKTRLVPLLEAVLEGLTAVRLKAEHYHDRFVWRAALVLAFSTATCILGLAGLMRSLAGRTDILEPRLLFVACLVPGLLVLACAVAFAFMWLAGTSRTHTVILELILVGGLGIVLSGYALAREANMEFDSASPSRHVLQDVRAEHVVTSGRRGRKHHHYYVHCRDWRSGHESRPMRLEVSSVAYERLRGSRSAVVQVRAGFLHFEWVESIEPEW